MVKGKSSSSDNKSFLIQDTQTVVFTGDSITDCGRRDVAAPLGNGYVKIAVDLIAPNILTGELPSSTKVSAATHLWGCGIAGPMTRWCIIPTGSQSW